MCGRFVATMEPARLADYLGVEDVRETLDPSWNVAPTDSVYAVIQARDGTRRMGTLRWGLVPHWAKDPGIGSRMINARAETLESKFRAAYQRRRCLIPADGFYEWEKRDDGTRRPFFIHRADGAPMVFAGLWELWREPGAPEDAEPLRTCTIVTTDANDLVRRVHDRMPVVLAPQDWGRWIDRGVTDTGALGGLLVPADPRQLDMVEVSTRVNNVRNNGAALIEPASSG
ncbi:MAG TPA: SOS response-associated peptidase [Acidimicrobiales bacterium]|nr:SOS response-associated peptidase [Acidimicrobiales bacterium]